MKAMTRVGWGVCIVVLIGLAVAGAANWSQLAANFFSFTVIDALGILASLFAAVYIGTVVQRGIGFEMKRREMLAALLEDVEGRIGGVTDVGVAYMEGTSTAGKSEVLRDLKIISNVLNQLREFGSAASLDLYDAEMRQSWRRFRKSLTDGSFGVEGAVFDDLQIGAVELQSQELLKRVRWKRLGLFGS